MRQLNQMTKSYFIGWSTSIIKIFLIIVCIVAFTAAALLITGCGSLQVALEDGAEITVSGPDEVSPTLTPDNEPIQPDIFGQDGLGPFYLNAPYGSVLDETQKVLVVREGIAAYEQSPAGMEILFDYSGPSGKIAFASEFFHASSDFSRSVTDLWIYDFATGVNEQVLQDDVSRAFWSPYDPESLEPQQLLAAVFNSDTGTYDLVLVNGPEDTQTIAQCASEEVSISPDGSQIAYKTSWYHDSEPRPEECQGVYVVNLTDQTSQRLTDTDPVATGGWIGDQPLWASSIEALIFNAHDEAGLFNLVPFDGSGWYRAEIDPSVGEDRLPTPDFALWSDKHQLVVGNVEGMREPFAIWIYHLSGAPVRIDEAYRINWKEYHQDLSLLGWWEPGESIIIRDHSYLSDLNPLGDIVVWSLTEEKVIDTISIKPEFPIELYPDDVTTGNADLDMVLRAFLTGSPSDRAALADTISAGCVNDIFSVGPPPCDTGMVEGTRLERFPYRRYREQRFVTPGEISELMDFGVAGLYAIAINPQTGFEFEYSPFGEYSIALVSDVDQKMIYVLVDQGRVVQIDFWELTPPETFSNYRGEYLLPPLP